MTAHDVILARLWAVIDRPHKGTAGTRISHGFESVQSVAYFFSISGNKLIPGTVNRLEMLGICRIVL